MFRGAFVRRVVFLVACLMAAVSAGAQVSYEMVPAGAALPQGGRVVEEYGEFSWVQVPGRPAGGQFTSPMIIFRGRTFDPAARHTLSPAELAALPPIDGAYLIQFAGPVKTKLWPALVTKQGLRIVDYVPDYCFLVWGKPSQIVPLLGLATTGGFPLIVHAEPVDWTMRVEPRLLAAIEGQPGVRLELPIGQDGKISVKLFLFDASAPGPEFVKLLAGMAPSFTLQSGAGRPCYSASLSLDEIKAIAASSSLEFAEASYGRVPHNNLVPDPYECDVSSQWTSGWTGAGIVVDHNDTGVDVTHPDLTTGVVTATSGTMSGIDNGHGTHTAGSIVGRGLAGSSPTNPDCGGDGWSGGPTVLPTIKGMAYGATLVTNNIGDGQTGDAAMMQWGSQHGATVSSNSWGKGTAGNPVTTYDSSAAAMDAAVRDADSSTVGNQEMSIVFSAGDDGSLGASSVASPGVAKNVLTVGATENGRCGSYVFSHQAGPDPALIDDFSSRGPSQGRIKPDVVAPGADVISTQSQDPAATYPWDLSWTGQYYALSTGTSMSCALVAGMDADFCQFYHATYGAMPSPALVKAALINGSVDVGPGYLSNAQGWGRANLKNSIAGPASGTTIFLDQRNVTPVATGGSYSTSFGVSSSAVPLKVTVVWTDPPGAASCTSCLVNDLNLEVIAPGGSSYHGNQFDGHWSVQNASGWDSANNVENVFVQAPAIGTWTVIVHGANVPTVPPGVTGGQDFAVAASGAICGSYPGAPSGLSATPNGSNRIDLAWSSGTPSGASYSVYRSLGACPGGSFSLIASGVATASYSDTTVSGGQIYSYEVAAVDGTNGCASALSSCASATATGACTAAPTFSGLSSVTNSQNSVCALILAWPAATASCGGPVSYAIYRSTTAPFTPSTSNMIHPGFTGTSYTDSAGLVSATTYYYIVRATDQANGSQDSNSVTLSGVPVASAPASSTLINEGFEESGGQPTSGGTWSHTAYVDPQYPANWAPDDWAQSTGGNPHSPTHAFHCSDPSLQKDDWLVTPSITLGNVSAQMTFWHTYQIEDSFDGGVIEISTDGGSTWTDLAPHITTGGYNGYIDVTTTDNNLAGRNVWTGGYVDTMRQVVVDLSAYRGENVQIRFRLGTDGSNAGSFAGWFIDDVVITTFSATTCTTCTAPSLPVINSITDVSACAQSGVQVNYTSGSPATRHDLYKDGSQVVSGYASGATYNPGDTSSHNYMVRAVNGGDICGTDSVSMPATDLNYTPGAPAITGITDEAVCAQSGIHVAYTAGAGATSHNLLKDGSVVVTGYSSGALYNPGDTSSHNYIVRAVRNGCTNDSAASAFADANQTPGTPAAPAVADISPCAQSGVSISWSAVSQATTYDLLVDGSTTISGVASPYSYNPGNTASHTYAVRGRNTNCTGAYSSTIAFADANNTPGAPAITNIADVSVCAQSGIQVTYTAGSGATSHSLLKDAVVVVTSYTSGATYNPGDTSSHTYVVRAINGTCTTDSAGSAFADANNTPGAPAITGIVDLDPCAATGIQVSYTAGSGATSHNLLKDGSVVVTGYASGATYVPGGTSSHTYVVQAVNGSCTHNSSGSSFSDANNTPGAPVITGITDIATCVQSGIQVNYTAGSGATSHNLLKDGSLAVTGYVSGAAYNPGDVSSHTYVIRAINGTCTTDSAGSVFADVVCPAPGEVSPGTTKATGMSWTAKTAINWQAASGTVDGYRLYRGTKAQLPYLVNSSTDSCTRYDGTALTFTLNGANDVPAAGTFIWFLVDAYNGAGEGSAGNALIAGSPVARTINSSGACTP